MADNKKSVLYCNAGYDVDKTVVDIVDHKKLLSSSHLSSRLSVKDWSWQSDEICLVGS